MPGRHRHREPTRCAGDVRSALRGQSHAPRRQTARGSLRGTNYTKPMFCVKGRGRARPARKGRQTRATDHEPPDEGGRDGRATVRRGATTDRRTRRRGELHQTGVLYPKGCVIRPPVPGRCDRVGLCGSDGESE